MQSTNWKNGVDALASAWDRCTYRAIDEFDEYTAAAMGWELRYLTETVLGCDLWLEAENLSADIDENGRAAATATGWKAQLTGRTLNETTRKMLAGLENSANGTAINVIAPLLGPWQLHEALAAGIETTRGDDEPLINALKRWMPTRPMASDSNTYLRDYAMPTDERCARLIITAAIAGLRINGHGFRTRSAAGASELANIMQETGTPTADRRIEERTAQAVLKAIGGSKADGRLSRAEAEALDAELTELTTTGATTLNGLPLRPLTLSWNDEDTRGENVTLRAQPGQRNPHAMLQPAEAALLARWAEPGVEVDGHLLRYLTVDDAAIELACESLPAMTESERWCILQQATYGLYGQDERAECSDTALAAIDRGTRRAVTAKKRMDEIGCYLIELHPAAQSHHTAAKKRQQAERNAR